MVDGAPVGIAIADPGGRLERVNGTLAASVGTVPGALVGRHWSEVVAREDADATEQLLRRLCSGARDREQVAQRWQHTDDHVVTVTVTATAVRGPGDGVRGVVLHVEGTDLQAQTEGRVRETGQAMADAAVQDAAAALGDAVTLEQVTAVVAQQVVAAFAADGLLIALVEGPRLRLVSARGYPHAAEVALSDLPMDDVAPMVEVVHRKIPRFFATREDYVAAYPGRAEVAALTGKRAWAFLPLVAAGRPIGSWTLSFDRSRAFTIAERALLIALSGLLAQAVARAQALDAERSLARALQGSLLPAGLPDVPHAEIAVRYRPAVAGVAVGGDFYDVVHLPGGGVSVVVGDVQGHSAEAAAVMGQVRSALRAYAAEGHGPAAVVARANRFLATSGIDIFVTCTYAHLDPPSGRLRIVRAGHVPPLLVRDGAAALLDVAGGLPLGVADDADYAAETIDLRAGDRLVLCTDGLVETRTGSLDDGYATLRRRAESAAEARLEAYADALLADDVSREDDVALLVLAYLGADDDDAAAASGTGPGGRVSLDGLRADPPA